MAFDDSYQVDGVTGAVRVIVTVSCVLLLVLFRHQFRDHPRETEAYVLLVLAALAALGAVTLAGANDLLLLIGAFMLASVSYRPLPPSAGSSSSIVGRSTI